MAHATVIDLKIILCGFIIISFSCCNNLRKENNLSFNYSIPIDVSKVTELHIEDIAAFHSIIPLKTPDEIIIGEIGAVFLTDSLLIVSDSKAKAVLVFDYQGNFRYKIGKRGQGPGEYSDLNDLYIDKSENRIYILDTPRQYILQYDLQGNFLYAERINYCLYSFIPYNKGYWGVNFAQNPDYYDLIYVDEKSEIKSGFFPVEAFKLATLPVSKFSYDDENILFYTPYNNGIYKIDQDNLTPYIHIDFGKDALPYTNLQPKKFLDGITHLHYFGRLHDVFIQKNKLFFSFSEYEGEKIISGYHVYTSLDTINPIIYNYRINHSKEVVMEPQPDILALSDSILVFQLVPNTLPDRLLDKLNDMGGYGINITSDSNPVLVLYKLKD